MPQQQWWYLAIILNFNGNLSTTTVYEIWAWIWFRDFCWKNKVITIEIARSCPERQKCNQLEISIIVSTQDLYPPPHPPAHTHIHTQFMHEPQSFKALCFSISYRLLSNARACTSIADLTSRLKHCLIGIRTWTGNYILGYIFSSMPQLQRRFN